MWQPITDITERSTDSDACADAAWGIVAAAAQLSEELARGRRALSFAASRDATLREVAPSDPDALLCWVPEAGWQMAPSSDAARHAVIDLYLPICSATAARPITVGHLGQSLDGFIATHAGDSQFVTGQENILHLHRMRALCDAVVVGAGTVAADDPQLTTRHVTGPSPLRVILDPGRGLAPDYRVFNDDLAPTLYVCARSLVQPGETHVGFAAIVPLDSAESHNVAALLGVLRERGCRR